MPLPALAAVILAAIFLPTVVILANVSRLQSQAMQYATQMPALPAQAGLNTSLSANSRPVYSQDLPEQSLPVALTDGNKQVFHHGSNSGNGQDAWMISGWLAGERSAGECRGSPRLFSWRALDTGCP